MVKIFLATTFLITGIGAALLIDVEKLGVVNWLVRRYYENEQNN